MRLPWWTLQTGFEMCKSMAELSGSAADVRDKLDDSSQARGPLPPGIAVGTKTDSQVRHGRLAAMTEHYGGWTVGRDQTGIHVGPASL